MFIFKNKFDENLKEILAIQEVFTDFLIKNYDKMEKLEEENLKKIYDRVSMYIILEQKIMPKFLKIKKIIYIIFYVFQFASLILGMIYLNFFYYIILLMISFLIESIMELIFYKEYNNIEKNFSIILKEKFGNCPVKENNFYDIKKDFYFILKFFK